jgi:hypothetical protein
MAQKEQNPSFLELTKGAATFFHVTYLIGGPMNACSNSSNQRDGCPPGMGRYC